MNSAIAAMLSNNSIDYVSCSEYFCLGKYLWLLEWFEKIIDFIQVVMRITNAKEVVNLYWRIYELLVRVSLMRRISVVIAADIQ